MRGRLYALLVATGMGVIGGMTYVFLRPVPGVTLDMLRDGGIEDVCSPVLLECDGRLLDVDWPLEDGGILEDVCRGLPDGGLRRRYLTARIGAYLCDKDAGDTRASLIFRWPACFRPLSEDFCRVINPDACDDSQACGDDDAGSPNWRAWQQPCACRTPGTICAVPNPDGGTAINGKLGVTLPPPWGGAGCVPKACSELAGEWRQSWPDECLLGDGGMP